MLQEPGVRLRRIKLRLNGLDCLIEAQQAFFSAAVFLAFGQAAPTSHHFSPSPISPLLLDPLMLTPILLKLLLDFRLQILNIDHR